MEVYREVAQRELGYPEVKELTSAMHFEGIITCDELCAKLHKLIEAISDNHVCVAGPLARPERLRGCHVLLAPEGGVPPLIEAGLRPLAVTTDADSSLSTLNRIVEISDYVMLHVHGDNLLRASALVSSVPRAKLLLTSQVDTPFCIYPSGAFTDGDRAAAIAMEMGASSIRLVGFDFSSVTCGHKDYCDSDEKSAKLRTGERVLLKVAGRFGYHLTKDLEGNLLLLK
ncbi:MAG: hypothetical protein RXQ79_03430 [Acidilobus sp.]